MDDSIGGGSVELTSGTVFRIGAGEDAAPFPTLTASDRAQIRRLGSLIDKICPIKALVTHGDDETTMEYGRFYYAKPGPGGFDVLCEVAPSFVHHVLDGMEMNPEAFGLN